MKMKGAYEQNSALGDPMSIEGQLRESNHQLDRLRSDKEKYQTMLDDMERSSPVVAPKNSHQPGATNGVQYKYAAKRYIGRQARELTRLW